MMANEDKRIIELPASESILNDDWIAKDSASQGTTKIQLSLLKQLFGGNNFAGEWQSGTTYSKDSYVTREGKLYHNITGSATSTTWKASQWQEIDVSSELKKVVGSLAPTFDSSTNYDVDDLVTFNGGLCRCISPHSAGAWNSSHFANVKVSSLLTYFIMDNFTDRQWENYSGSPVNYTKGTVIHKGLSMYRCKANTTNQSWDSSKWEQVDVTDLINSVTALIETVLSNLAPTFSSSIQYSINDFVIYNNHLYICVKPHLGSWNATDFSAGIIGNILEAIFNNIADVYSPSGSYVKGDVVNYLGMPLRCIVDTATSPLVFSEWEQVTVEQLIDEKVADVQIAGQTTTDENKISDLTSLAIEGTASGEIASFSDGSNLPMRSFICNIDAVQDLHGQDGPWVGGAGKNKFDSTLMVNPTSSAKWVQVQLEPNTTYTVSSNIPNSYTSAYIFAIAGTDVSGVTSGANGVGQDRPQKITTGADGILSFGYRTSGQGGVILDLDDYYYQIELGEQATTFAPYSNICPISGHTEVNAWVRGKNQLPMTVDGIKAANTGGTWTGNAYALNGITYTILTDNDGNVTGIKANGTASANATLDLNPTGSLTIPANTTFSLSGCPDGGGGSTYRLYPKGGTSATYDNGSGKLITLDSAITNPFRINVYSGAQVDNIIFYPMIVYTNAIDKDFEPYNSNSQTIQVSWQTEAGEVYEGYVDLVSGILTVTHKSQTGFTRGSQDSSNKLYNIGTISDIKAFTDGSNISPYFINSMFEKMSLAGARAAETPSIVQYNKAFYVGGYIGKSAELDTLLESLQVKYELKTPITYQLTPTQIKSLKDDITNAWCSTGDVNVKFNKDATTVINSLIARIEALENA